MRTATRLAAITGASVMVAGFAAAPAASATTMSGTTTWVDPGTGTISAAVAHAHPGDTIRLKAGTYFDSVFIPMTLTIKGAGWDKTTVKPAPNPKNLCDAPGDISGFCALGGVDQNFNPDLSKPVVNVTVEDLRTTGFSDTGVIGFNTKGMHVTNVRSDHNGGYGIARFVSTDSLFDHNWTSYNTEAGLYMGDSPDADSVISWNKTDHNGFGVFMRDSRELTAMHNTVWDNCVGILALNSGHGAPGDLPAGFYYITANLVFDNDTACPASEGPALSGLGIALAGVQHVLVNNNRVTNNHPGGPSLVSAGIAIVSTKSMGGTDPTHNTVRNNFVRNNVPVDIAWDGTGSGNVIRTNDCRKTVPMNREPAWCSA